MLGVESVIVGAVASRTYAAFVVPVFPARSVCDAMIVGFPKPVFVSVLVVKVPPDIHVAVVGFGVKFVPEIVTVVDVLAEYSQVPESIIVGPTVTPLSGEAIRTVGGVRSIVTVEPSVESV